MKINKCRAAIAAIGMGLALVSVPAAAAITFFSPITTFEDDNLDFVVDSGAGNIGTIGVGDRLVSVFEYNQTTGTLGGQGPNPILPQELTGVADLTVIAVLVDGTLVLAPSGAAGVLSAFAAGTAYVTWIDNSPDVNVINSTCGTRAQCLALAGLGGGDPDSTVYFSATFAGDADTAWRSTVAAGGANIATVEAGPATQIFASFNYALMFGINNTGVQFGLQPCFAACSGLGDGLTQIVGSGNVLGGQNLDHTQWTARSDNDAQVVPIPEPGSLALLGLGLLGLLGFGIRKRNT